MINFVGNSDRVGIEETDNLSLFDKFCVPLSPPSWPSPRPSIFCICKRIDILKPEGHLRLPMSELDTKRIRWLVKNLLVSLKIIFYVNICIEF